jgi:hypothetical protein
MRIKKAVKRRGEREKRIQGFKWGSFRREY